MNRESVNGNAPGWATTVSSVVASGSAAMPTMVYAEPFPASFSRPPTVAPVRSETDGLIATSFALRASRPAKTAMIPTVNGEVLSSVTAEASRSPLRVSTRTDPVAYGVLMLPAGRSLGFTPGSAGEVPSVT